MENSLKNVDIEKKANVYFDGKVSSRTIFLNNGNRVTLGFMLAGEYEFSTNEKEIMELSAGTLEVKLPQSNEWQIIEPESSFEVPANAMFKVKVAEFADYCCSYVTE